MAVFPVSGNDRNINELHVVVALKNYMESHLFFKYSEISSVNTLRVRKSNLCERTKYYTNTILFSGDKANG